MPRQVTEVHTYSRAKIEQVLKCTTQLAVMNGSMYVGEFHNQLVVWNTDGSAIVTTQHTPSTLEEEMKKIKAA